MLINLIGPMAVGKSYFAQRFVKEHPEFIAVSIDQCRIEAGKNLDYQDNEGDKSSALDIEMDAWYNVLRGCLENENVILESSGLSWRLKGILWHPDIITRGVYSVKLTGNYDKCLKRLEEREKQEVPFPFSFEKEESCKWLFDNMHRVPHNLLMDVDSGQDYDIMFNEAVKFIMAAKLKYDADLVSLGKNELIKKRGAEMSNTKVTDVAFFASKKKGKIKAFANVTFNGDVVVRGYKICEGAHGLFVGAPSQLSPKDQKWYDNVTYVNDEMRTLLHDEILNRFRKSSSGETTSEALNQVNEDEIPF